MTGALGGLLGLLWIAFASPVGPAWGKESRRPSSEKTVSAVSGKSGADACMRNGRLGSVPVRAPENRAGKITGCQKGAGLLKTKRLLEEQAAIREGRPLSKSQVIRRIRRRLYPCAVVSSTDVRAFPASL